MNCPSCGSTATSETPHKTALGYRTFRCSACKRRFNERTGTPFNHLQVPTDIMLWVVLWRLCYKLSLRDLAEMFLERGFAFTHEAVRDWEARFALLLTQQLRAKRRGTVSSSWYVDETYVRVAGEWCYLYRAIDREGKCQNSAHTHMEISTNVRRFTPNKSPKTWQFGSCTLSSDTSPAITGKIEAESENTTRRAMARSSGGSDRWIRINEQAQAWVSV